MKAKEISKKSKFPFVRKCTVTMFKKGDGDNFNLNFDIENLHQTFSKFNQNSVFQVNFENALLDLAIQLHQYLDIEGTADKEQQFNMNRAIHKIKEHFRSSKELNKLMNERFANFQEYLQDKTEFSYESSSDEEDSWKKDQTLPEDCLDKPGIFTCKRCKWKIGGVTCETIKNGQVCGEILLLKQNGFSYCPRGCGEIYPPKCCAKKMIASFESDHIIAPFPRNQERNTDDCCPVFTCKKCSFSVDGFMCYSCSKSGNHLRRSGFFERVWCSYVWVCQSSCGRDTKGGLMHGNITKCGKCNASSMREMQYEEINGPPQN